MERRELALQAKRKLNRGESITDDERAAVAWYVNRQRGDLSQISVPRSVAQEWKAKAKDAGGPLNQWVMDQVEFALAGNHVSPDYVKRLKEELDEKVGFLRAETRRREILESRVAELDASMRQYGEVIVAAMRWLSEGGVDPRVLGLTSDELDEILGGVQTAKGGVTNGRRA